MKKYKSAKITGIIFAVLTFSLVVNILYLGATGKHLISKENIASFAKNRSKKEVVEYALEPLKTIKGHVFACLGNHDLETEASIKTAFEHCGIHLLSDDSVTLRITGCESPIQIVGFNYHPSHIHDNTMIYQRVFEQNPSPTPDTICLVLVCHFVF